MFEGDEFDWDDDNIEHIARHGIEPWEAEEMKEIKSPDEIPEFETEREEHEFWSTHSLSEEFFEKAEPIPEGVLPPPRPRTRPISLRFDEDVLARVKAVAKSKNKGYQTVLKEFVVERLYEEEKREGIIG